MARANMMILMNVSCTALEEVKKGVGMLFQIFTINVGGNNLIQFGLYLLQIVRYFISTLSVSLSSVVSNLLVLQYHGVFHEFLLGKSIRCGSSRTNALWLVKKKCRLEYKIGSGVGEWGVGQLSFYRKQQQPVKINRVLFLYILGL